MLKVAPLSTNEAFCNSRCTQHLEDMEEVIVQYRSTLASYPPGDPIRFKALNGIAVALLDRFGCTQKSEDADEASTHLSSHWASWSVRVAEQHCCCHG